MTNTWSGSVCKYTNTLCFYLLIEILNCMPLIVHVPIIPLWFFKILNHVLKITCESTRVAIAHFQRSSWFGNDFLHRQTFLVHTLSVRALLVNFSFCQQLAAQMPAKTWGYPWQLVYSTSIHGSSLKTLYRNMAGLDCPVLLVIKDMHKKVCIWSATLQGASVNKGLTPINSTSVSYITRCLGHFRCLGLFLPIHSKSVNTAMAPEKPSCSASTLTFRYETSFLLILNNF